MSQTYKAIEALAQHALDQGILDRHWSVEELFPGNFD
jgi:hypothetical protein